MVQNEELGCFACLNRFRVCVLLVFTHPDGAVLVCQPSTCHPNSLRQGKKKEEKSAPAADILKFQL